MFIGIYTRRWAPEESNKRYCDTRTPSMSHQHLPLSAQRCPINDAADVKRFCTQCCPPIRPRNGRRCSFRRRVHRLHKPHHNVSRAVGDWVRSVQHAAAVHEDVANTLGARARLQRLEPSPTAFKVNPRPSNAMTSSVESAREHKKREPHREVADRLLSQKAF